jgi:LacI family transcriptional regulator
MRELRDAGLRVPEDISVVAFDDLPLAITIDPFFTVAAQPAYELGQQATALLLARLVGEGPEGCQDIVLSTEIIVRKSSGKPASHGH